MPHRCKILHFNHRRVIWCGGYSISINTCWVKGARVRVQVFKRKLHIYIHLNYTKVEIISCIKKKKDITF